MQIFLRAEHLAMAEGEQCQILQNQFRIARFHSRFTCFQSTPGPWLMEIQIMRNSKFQKSPNIHLVRPIIHLVPKFALSD